MSATGNQEVWRAIFAEGHPKLKSFQRLHSWLPSPPRCKMCFAPFGGVGSVIMRLRGKGPSNRNPHYCSACDAFIRAFPGGAEVELSILFVDVRNSVGIAERLGPTGFSQVMSSFYAAATKSLIATDGFVIDFMGDAVAGIYPPGFCGPHHARKAVQAAEHLLRESMPRYPDGTELPIGVGVHTGTVFIGTVSGAEGGIQDVQPLGDNVNITSRLSAMAAPGEALISDACWRAAGGRLDGVESRELQLKGRTAPITVRVITRQSPTVVH